MLWYSIIISIDIFTVPVLHYHQNYKLTKSRKEDAHFHLGICIIQVEIRPNTVLGRINQRGPTACIMLSRINITIPSLEKPYDANALSPREILQTQIAVWLLYRAMPLTLQMFNHEYSLVSQPHPLCNEVKIVETSLVFKWPNIDSG